MPVIETHVSIKQRRQELPVSVISKNLCFRPLAKLGFREMPKGLIERHDTVESLRMRFSIENKAFKLQVVGGQ